MSLSVNEYNEKMADFQRLKKQQNLQLTRIASADTVNREKVEIEVSLAEYQLKIVQQFLAQPQSERRLEQFKEEIHWKHIQEKPSALGAYQAVTGARDAYIEGGQKVGSSKKGNRRLERGFVEVIERVARAAEERLQVSQEMTDKELERLKNTLDSFLARKNILYNQILDDKTEMTTEALDIESSALYKKLEAELKAMRSEKAVSDPWKAAEVGHIRFIEKQLEGCQTDEERQDFLDQRRDGETGETMLHCAFRFGQRQVAHFLLDNGASPDIPDSRGYQPLHCLTGSDIEEMGDIGERITIAADLLGRLSEEKAKDLLNAKGAEDRIPLHRAAFHGYFGLVNLYLKYGANVNAQDSHGQTSLHEAVRMGRELVAATLVKSSELNVMVPDKIGVTPLRLSVESGQAEIMTLILNHESWRQNPVKETNQNHIGQLLQIPRIPNRELVIRALRPFQTLSRIQEEFWIAAREGNIKTIENHMLGMRQEVRAEFLGQTYLIGQTLLHQATIYGQEEMVEFLLNEGISFSIADARGFLPIHYAAEEGNIGIAKRFLQKDQELVNVQGDEKATPLHRAVLSGEEPMVRFLLENGAEVNAQTIKGETPLHFAISHQKLGVIKILLEAEHLNVIVRNNKRYTPLYYAANFGLAEVTQKIIEHDTWEHPDSDSDPNHVVRLFIGLRANQDTKRVLLTKIDDVNARDAAGKTFLHHAVERGASGDVVVLAERQDLNVVALDQEGYTALYHAKGNDPDLPVIVNAIVSHKSWQNPENEEDPSHIHGLVNMTKINPALEDVLLTRFDTSKPISEGKTLLHYAVINGADKLSKQMLEDLSLEINLTDQKKFTALYYAVNRGDMAIVQGILRHPNWSNPRNEKDQNHTAQLMMMEPEKNTEEVRNFVGLCEKLRSFPNPWEAAKLGVVGILDGYIQAKDEKEAKSFLDQQNAEGQTPLHFACGEGHLHVVNFLFDNQVNLTVVNSGEEQPILAAVREGFTDVVAIILHQGWQPPQDEEDLNHPIHLIEMSVSTPSLAKLLLPFVDPNTAMIDEMPLLHYSVLEGDPDFTAILLENGDLDVNQRDKGSKTALYYMVANGDDNASRILRHKKWRNPQDQTDPNHTKQLVEIAQDDDSVKRTLVAFNKLYEEDDPCAAVDLGAIGILAEKLEGLSRDEAKAYVNRIGEGKEAPLHIASRKGNKDMVDLLLKYRADVTAEDGYKHQPITLAVRPGYYEIIQTLMDHGWKSPEDKKDRNHIDKLTATVPLKNAKEVAAVFGVEPLVEHDEVAKPYFRKVVRPQSRVEVEEIGGVDTRSMPSSELELSLEPSPLPSNLFEFQGELQEHTDSVTLLTSVSDGSLISGSWDKTIRLWNLSNGDCAKTIEQESHPMSFVTLPGSKLGVGSTDGTLSVWDMDLGNQEFAIKNHTSGIKGLVKWEDQIVSGSLDGTIRLWDLSTKSETKVVDCGAPIIALCALAHKKKTLVYSGFEDGSVKMWNLSTDRAIDVKNKGKPVSGFAVMPGGVLAIGVDSEIWLWDHETQELIKKFPLTYPITALNTSIDGMLLIGHKGGNITGWDIGKNDIAWSLDGLQEDVLDLLVLQDGRLASSSSDRSIYIWSKLKD